MQRRQFMKYSAAALATPYVVSGASRSAGAAAANGKRVRRDVMSMAPDDPFFRQYAKAIDLMHKLPDSDQRNWRNQALIHLNFCPHGSLQFVHWHRYYVNFFEQIVGELIGVPTFAMPYWNWSAGHGQIPDPFYDIDALNPEYWKDKSDATSTNWGTVNSVGFRAMKKGQGVQDSSQAFSYQNIATILRQSDFNAFTNQLETQPHNNGHVIVGMGQTGIDGHMADGMSPLDPIFWLHHANVDRIWAEWEAASPQHRTPGWNYDYAGQFVDAQGRSVQNATSQQSVDLANFDFTYDTLLGAGTMAAAEATPNALLSAQAVGRQPLTLGAAEVDRTGGLGNPVSVGVTAANLADALFDKRVFWAPRAFEAAPTLGAEGGRVLATITLADPPGPVPMLVDVYVNKPEEQLAAAAAGGAKADQHYAGTFSFFGMNMAMHEAHGHPEVIVDITEPLRRLTEEGALTTTDVAVQLVPVPSIEGASTDATFKVDKIALSAA